MDTLRQTVKDTVFSYVGGGFNVRMFTLADEEHGIYAVNIVDSPVRKQPAGVVLLARVVGDQVVIEEDTTDRPLFQALMHRGVPREQIILAYANEAVPDAEPDVTRGASEAK